MSSGWRVNRELFDLIFLSKNAHEAEWNTHLAHSSEGFGLEGRVEVRVRESLRWGNINTYGFKNWH